MNNTVEQTGGSIVISMVCKLLLLNELCTITVGNEMIMDSTIVHIDGIYCWDAGICVGIIVTCLIFDEEVCRKVFCALWQNNHNSDMQ